MKPVTRENWKSARMKRQQAMVRLVTMGSYCMYWYNRPGHLFTRSAISWICYLKAKINNLLWIYYLRADKGMASHTGELQHYSKLSESNEYYR